MPLSERFWKKVDVRGPNECWLWTGATGRAGYGTHSVAGKTEYAHRLALADKLGRPIVGVAMHSCDNPPCVNPAHLREGTPQENSQEACDRGLVWMKKRTHCPQGHEYAGENLWVGKTRSGRPHRRCRTCDAARSAIRYGGGKKAEEGVNGAEA